MNKSELNLAIESCNKMKLVAECLEVDGNVRHHAIKTALRYTLQACGLIECKGCKAYAVEAMPKSEMCNDCLMSEYWTAPMTDEDYAEMDAAGQIK